MFTGIVEEIGTVVETEQTGGNLVLTVSAKMTPELKIDQSLSHNGVCLTVTGFVEIRGERCYTVTAIDETLRRTNLPDLKTGSKVNLERCLPANGRLDGHIVQGHVDATGVVQDVLPQNGSWVYRIGYPAAYRNLIIEKGSICLNGISLTVVEAGDDIFTVAVIPYTYENTNISRLQPLDRVNLEFDIIGKYLQRALSPFTQTAQRKP